MIKYQSQVSRIYAKKTPVNTLRKRSNVSLTDTKGFIPLKVQIKRYILAGARLQTLREQYTSEDYLYAYEDVPMITQDMDITEIQEFVVKVNERLEERRLQRTGAEELSSPQTVGKTEVPEGSTEVFPQAGGEVSSTAPEAADGEKKD